MRRRRRRGRRKNGNQKTNTNFTMLWAESLRQSWVSSQPWKGRVVSNESGHASSLLFVCNGRPVCVAQGRTKRFCGATTKQRAELGMAHSEQKGKSSNVGWGTDQSAGSLANMLIVGCKQKMETQTHARTGGHVAIVETV